MIKFFKRLIISYRRKRFIKRHIREQAENIRREVDKDLIKQLAIYFKENPDKDSATVKIVN